MYVHIYDTAGIPLGVLASGVAQYLAANASPPFCFKKGVNGPLSALHQSIHRAGWKFKSPFVLEDRVGRELHLPTVCPVRVANMFEKDLGDTIVHREAVRLHLKLNNSETQSLRDAGIFMHPLVNLYNKWDYTASRTLLSIVSDGIFTNTDLCNFGYDVDPTCSNCGLALDTVFHQCYSCPGIGDS